MCAFIIASEMNYVDDDDGMLQDYTILERILFSPVFFRLTFTARASYRLGRHLTFTGRKLQLL
jgi:hypothetical protein